MPIIWECFMEIREFLADLEYLVNIDSGYDAPDGVAKCSEFFREKFDSLGWITETHDVGEGIGPLLICKNREAEHYDLIMIGHLDTVFPKGTAAERPFRIEDDKAYGPGVGDMKDGDLLIYYVLRDAPREITDRLNILVIYNPDEERGSFWSKAKMREYAKITDYAFVYEGTGECGYYCIRKPGSVSFKVDFHGIKGHCGSMHTNGARSAISEMARWITEIDSRIPDKSLGTTANVGVVSGGTARNVVADEASMNGSIRLIDPKEFPRIYKTFERLTAGAKKRGIGVDIVYETNEAVIPGARETAYYEHLNKIGEPIGLPFKYRDTTGGLSDMNRIAPCDVICIDSLGPVCRNIHNEGEYMAINSVEYAYRMSQLLLSDLASNK